VFLQTEAERERWTVRIAIAAVIISIFAVLFSFFQWRSAERAANIAEQARLDAKLASSQSLAIAEQARTDAVNGADQQRHDSALALESQTKRADRANVLADRSAKAAEETARLGSLQIEANERAWVTVSVGEQTGNFAVAMRNTGRSPAINVTQVTAFSGGSRMKPPDVDLSQNSSTPISLPKNAPPEFVERLKKEGYIRDHPPTGYVIAPGDSQISSDYQGKFAQIFRMNADRAYIEGKVTYDDIFGKHHETQFCYWFAPPSDFVMCNDHNKMD
jgi:hypothetical protein